ncbi:MAG: MerR family transcriptional regulator [Pseudomonadota bacterium]
MTEDKIWYKIGTLARKSGVSPTLLRVWEKRYGLWAPQRGAGGHRLYSHEDVLLVCSVAQLVAGGHRIGELALLGREQLLRQVRSKGGPGDKDGATASLREPEATVPAGYIAPLLAAAQDVDALKLRAALDRALLELSPDQVVYDVFVPAMVVIGESYLAGRVGVAGEHLVSCMIEHYLHNCIDQARRARPGTNGAQSTVVCSCFPGDEHRIGLLVVAYALTREGCDVVYLGAALPLADLEQTVDQLQPSSVWLSVSDSARYRKYRSALAALVRRHPFLFVVGGQGVPVDDLLLQEAGCQLWSPVFKLVPDIQRLIRRVS